MSDSPSLLCPSLFFLEARPPQSLGNWEIGRTRRGGPQDSVETTYYYLARGQGHSSNSGMRMRTSSYLLRVRTLHYITLYVCTCIQSSKGAVEPSRWSPVGLYIVRQIFAYLLVVAIRSCSFRTPARLLPASHSAQLNNKIVRK